MEVYNCYKPNYKCKTKIKSKGKCKNIDLCVKCPPSPSPLTPMSDVIYQRYTVGGGEGSLLNMYTVDVPAGTQSITVRCIAAGGSGGACVGEIIQIECDGKTMALGAPSGGGGAGGQLAYIHLPWTPGNPTQLNIEVGYASATPSDPVTGVGVDGGDTIVTFSPSYPGFEEIRAIGGKGGKPGMLISSTSGIVGHAGDGGVGSNGGGGGSSKNTCEGMDFLFSPGVGGLGLSRQSGGDGNDERGGDGGLNAGNDNSNLGGAGGAGPVERDTGGLGGTLGDLSTSNAGGNHRLQDTGSGAGGAAHYLAEMSEVGTTVFAPGGRAAHGRAEVWFYIHKIPS